ncbi:MAG: hypothetical protein GXP09_11410 [Gammaproteobacteria bacterium]|nr:hypothetical protein [Gammaproteobacteria bacterium]
MQFRAITFLLLVVFAPVTFAVNASDYDKKRFSEACQSSSNIQAPTCDCMGDKAKKELSPNGFIFLTASLEKDDATTSALRQTMPPVELMQAGMFMVSGASACAQ